MRIALPKAEWAKPQKIAIKAGSGQQDDRGRLQQLVLDILRDGGQGQLSALEMSNWRGAAEATLGLALRGAVRWRCDMEAFLPYLMLPIAVVAFWFGLQRYLSA